MRQTTVRRGVTAAILALVCASFATEAFADKVFELGAETKQQLDGGAGSSYPSYPAYPAPQMVNQTPKAATQRPPVKLNVRQDQQRPPFNVGASANVQPQRPPIPLKVEQPGVLPAQFLGSWQVAGTRSNVEAQPQFQAGVGGIFQAQNMQTWNIQGNPGSGYALSSDTGVQTAIYIDKVQGNTAFIRYQHQIKNTMAQEAIVMQLSPDGRAFEGLERISIVKQGEPQPRAKVTYQLTGRRR